MKEYRDEELGALVSRLDDSPPPAPGFEERVWERIEAGGVIAPAVGARTFGARHRRPLLLAAAATVAAAGVVAVVVLFGLPGASRETGPAPVSAAMVSGRMAEAMSSFRTLQGTMTMTGTESAADYDGGTFMTDAAGDFSLRFAAAKATKLARATKLAQPVVMTYNARRHVVIDTYVEPDGSVTSSRWDQTVPYEGIGVTQWSGPFPPGYAWLVRAALADDDPHITVADTVFDGRSAWKVSLPLSTRRFGYMAGMSFVVDRRTGFLVHSSWPAYPFDPSCYPAGSSSLTDLRVNQPLPAGAFSTSVPPGAKLTYDVKASYYCTLAQVPARVGFRPFLPSYLPPGYGLSDVATDPRYALDYSGWGETAGVEHDPHTEAFLRYRHGGNAFTVHAWSIARLARTDLTELTRDLPMHGYLFRGSALLRAGAFVGCRAYTWFDQNGANLDVLGKGYLVYISGSLTRQELYEVASSLKQM